MSHDLSWDNHYKYILSNAYKMLGLLRRTFPKVDCVQAKKALYLSLIRSKLTYCSPIWRPHFLKDIQSIENVQRRATKFITNDYSSDYKYRLICLQILPLMMQFELNDVMFFVSSIFETLLNHLIFYSMLTSQEILLGPRLITNLFIICLEPTKSSISTAIVYPDFGTLFLPSILTSL